jgi:hypothetical protein
LQNQIVTIIEPAEHIEEMQIISIPDSCSGDIVQCCIAFIIVERQMANNSNYMYADIAA